MRVQSLQPLILVFRPWLVTGFTGGMGAVALVVGIVRTVRVGFGWDSTWGALLAAVLCFTVGSFANRFWTVRFDASGRTVRWRVWTVWGVRQGTFRYDEIVGVAHPAGKANSGRTPRGIALVLADGASFRLSYHNAVGRGFERLERIGLLIRRELGIGEPEKDLEIADAITSAESDLAAARAAKELLGVPLHEAKAIARRLRHGDHPPE